MEEERNEEIAVEESKTETEKDPKKERQKEIVVIKKISRDPKKKKDLAEETKTEEPKEEIAVEAVNEAPTEEEAKAPLETMTIEIEGEIVCPHCGRTIPAVAKHCPYCGKALQAEEKGKAPGRNKLIWIAAAAAVFALAFFLFVVPMINKANKYKNAISKLHEGNYAEARSDFSDLEDYKQAQDYVTYCQALDAFSKAELSKAKERFESVGELEDAPRYVNYVSAMQDINGDLEVNYGEAKEFFEKAEGLLDSEGMAKYCLGINSYLNEKENDAISQLQEVLDEAAISDYFLNRAGGVISFLKAKQKFDANDYSVLDELRTLASGDNELISSAAANHADYIEGMKNFEEELYYTASTFFSKCWSFKDAADLEKACYQDRPSTGIIYRDTTGSAISLTIYDPSDGEDMFVKIYDTNDKLVESLYIRDGSSATAHFQAGRFRLATATGYSDYWFGPKEAFGSHGSYERQLLSGSDEYYSFSGGMTYTLRFNVSNGNVGSKGSNYGDF